jgi:hypothetical protein
MKRNTRRIRPTHPATEAQPDPAREPLVVQPTHPVLVAVSEHLHRHNISHAIMSNGNGLLFTMARETFAWSNVVTVYEEKCMLRITCRLPVFVPAPKRQEVGAFLTRLNYGNLIGSWQMDYRDGEVAYVATHLFGSNIPEDKDIRVLMMITTGMMGGEGPKILARMQPKAGRLTLPPEPQRN